MNNSAEAEKIKTDQEFFNDWKINYFGEKQRPTPIPDHIHDLMKSYHNFAREKELAQLTDEVIEEIVDSHEITFRGLSIRTEGAKIIVDYLKQNNPKK